MVRHRSRVRVAPADGHTRSGRTALCAVPAGVRQAKAADLVTLFLAVPALALGLWKIRTGSDIARVLTIGTLAYLAYSYAIYAFSVVINPMTPVHIAILGLAIWAALLMVASLRDEPLARSQASSRAARCWRPSATSTCRRTRCMRSTWLSHSR